MKQIEASTDPAPAPYTGDAAKIGDTAEFEYAGTGYTTRVLKDDEVPDAAAIRLATIDDQGEEHITTLWGIDSPDGTLDATYANSVVAELLIDLQSELDADGPV